MTGPKILAIHGLAPKPRPEVLLQHVRQCWPIEAPQLQIELLYWADLAGHPYQVYHYPHQMRPLSRWERIIRPIRAVPRNVSRWLFEHCLATALGVEGVCGTAHLLPTWLIGDHVEATGRHLFGASMADIAAYFQVTHGGLRDRILARLAAQQWDGTHYDLVIAHSMGSIIALDLLRHGVIKTDRLCTIGSQLGMGIVHFLLNKYYPVRQRNSATWAWWNIADPLDVVAIDKTLSDEGYSDGYIMDVDRKSVV